MRIQLLLLLLTIAFASNVARQSGAGHNVETKYLIELPDAFVKTLNTDDTGKANLWHPKLTLTKVHSVQDAAKVAGQEKKANNPSPAFASFLQVKQSNSATDSLTYISGGENGTSVVASSKMNCGCRFVKDPNGMSFIQTDQTVSVASTDSQLQAATSFIEKEDKETSVTATEKKSDENVSLVQESQKLIENDVEEKEKVSSVDDDAELNALLEKKEKMKKMEEDLEKELAKEQAKKEQKDQEKLMLELLEKEEKSKKEAEDKEMTALLEKKKMLAELQAEEEAYRAKLKKMEEEEELMKMLEKEKKQLEELKELEKMRERENDLNRNSKMSMLLEETERPTKNNRDSFDEMLYRDEILAELRGKEPRQKDDLKDKFQMLFDDVPEPRHENDNNDLEDFLEFSQMYQKYEQYKSLLTEQQSKQKNRRPDLDGYGTDKNDRDLEDYQLLKKIKGIEDKQLRQELIEALLSQ